LFMSRVLSSLIFKWISVLKEIPIQGRPLSITPKQQHPQGHPKGWSLGEEHVPAAWMGWDGMGMPSLVTSAYTGVSQSARHTVALAHYE